MVNVLVVVAEFPSLSETFVLDQITGLIDRGLKVSVLGIRPKGDFTSHPQVLAYKLLDHTYYVDADALNRRGIRANLGLLAGTVRRRRFKLALEVIRLTLRWKLRRGAAVDSKRLLAYAETLATIPAPDLVLCHFGPHGDLMVRVRAALSGQWPVATFFHGYDISTLLRKHGPALYDRLFAAGDLFLTVSHFFQARLLEIGAAKDKVTLIRMGVHPPGKGTRPVRQRNDQNFVFVTVGRLVGKKGHSFAIRAMAHCKKQAPDTRLRLVIIGGGPLDAELRALAMQQGVETLVEFRGPQPRDQVAQALADADAFLMPSVTAEDGDMEGTPVAISEAMAMELPVVATYHGGIPDGVTHEVTGLLTPERDAEALGTAMLRLAHEPEFARTLGQAGRRKLQEELTLDMWNDRLVEKLVSLVGSAAPVDRKETRS